MKQPTLISILYFLALIIGINKSFSQEPGMISINSKPSGAKVFINGEDTGRTTPFQRALSPGKYNYKLIHEGFRELDGEFQIRESDIQVINTELVPLFSIVKIITNPEGAEVSIDGRKKGTTPLTLNDIPTGSHSVKITKNPYVAIDTTFSNEDGKYTELNFNLVSNLAILGILAYPDAEIFIDGKRMANRIYSGHLEEGSYVVRAEKDGFVPEEKTVTISRGKDTNLQFELQKIKSNLSIISEPTAAKVFIDDQLMGETPLVINSLDIGNYELKLTKEDYDVWIEKVEIKSGDLINKIVTLKWGETVEFITNPAGASIFIDGEKKGETPVNLTLKKGTYHFKFSKYGFEDFEAMHKISKEEKIQVSLKTKELPLSINTTPPGAKVIVNGKLRGKTPINSTVNFGDANIQITKKGYKSIYDEYLVENVPLDLNYILEFDKIRKKGEAVLYSALFPGAGQSYLSRKGSPYLLGMAAAGCLGGSFYYNQQAVSLYDEYLSEVSNIGLREQLKSDWQKNKDTSQNLLYGAIGIYAVNLLWVALMPDDTKRIKELGFKANYNNDLKTQEIGITFKF